MEPTKVMEKRSLKHKLQRERVLRHIPSNPSAGPDPPRLPPPDEILKLLALYAIVVIADVLANISAALPYLTRENQDLLLAPLLLVLLWVLVCCLALPYWAARQRRQAEHLGEEQRREAHEDIQLRVWA